MNTRKIMMVWLVVFLLMAATAPSLWAQATTGSLRGLVTDPTGAVIPGANVTLISASGERRTLTTDATGNYLAVQLQPGTYTVEFSIQGFTTQRVEGVKVAVTEVRNLDAQLTVSKTQETVTVTANADLLQTSTPTEGRVIEDTTIRQLPLPSRNFQQLLALSPGTSAALSNTTELGRGDSNIYVNGNRSTSNNVVVNGTEVNSPGTNSTPNISVPAPDAIQEFIVQTSMYDATQGRNSGGNVAAVTRSGSDAFHGSVYEFLRNRVLNANDFFLNAKGRPRPILTRNQFGGTLGGPIVKDKTFFFFSYQGTRERNGASLTNSLTFPNIPAGLTDDRSDTALAALTSQFSASAPSLPPITLSPISKALLQARLPNGQYAIPSAAGAGASALTLVSSPLSGVSRYREDQISLNIDQVITANNKLSGKFFLSNSPQYQSLFSFVGSNPQQIPGYGGNIDFHNRVLTISDTQIFGPSLINEARFGFSRINGPSTPEEPFTNAKFGINNPLAAQYPGLATIQVLGLFSIGSTTLADQRSTTETFTWSDTLSYTRGRHFLRFGGDVRRYHVDFFFNFFSRGQINFNSFRDFLAGNIAFGLLGNGVRDRYMRATDMDWFVQDDFHVSDSLTLNAGLRVEFNGGISELRGRLANFNPAAYASNSFPCTIAAPCNPPNGFTLLKPGETLNPNDWNLAPRFGFAWKPLAGKNLVWRGGFGVYFDRFSTRIANMQIFNYPYDVVGLGLGSFANPFPNLANVNFPISPAPIPSPIPFYFAGIPLTTNRTPISGVYVNPNFRTPYVYQYNFGFQWEPIKNWMVELGYVGSKGTKLINVLTLVQGSTGTPPYLVAYGLSNNKVLNGLQMAETTANSHYDSLQASVTKRFSQGLQFLTSYTYGRSIDDASGSPTNELAALPGDQQNRRSNRALSDFDRTQRLVFSGVWDLPKVYGGESRFAKSLLNDWEMSTILTLQSGTPFSVVCASGSTLLNRADLISNAALNPGGSVNDRLGQYFNTSAFSPICVNAAPYGTSGRNIIRGPGQRNMDFSVIKFIPVTEKTKLEFRTEFFNLFNTVNFANPSNNVLVPGTDGKITSASSGPRVLQFALKYTF